MDKLWIMKSIKLDYVMLLRETVLGMTLKGLVSIGF